MNGEALYMTLRVPDPSALTALATLRGMHGTAPRALERGRVWFHGGGASFDNRAGAWFNPNKEAGLVWQQGACPWPGRAEGPAWWVLVRERDSDAEAFVLRSLRESGLPAPEALVTAMVWRLWFDGEPGSARAAAEAIAVVRDGRQGLLANPHSQACWVCPPPETLRELREALVHLRERAS